MQRNPSFFISSLMLGLLVSCVPPGTEAEKGEVPQNSGFPLIFLGLMILVLWLFFIRPQAKRAKNQKKFIEELQKGDKIVTIAGIHGTIHKINEDGTLNVEISPGSYIKMEKSAVSMDWTLALNKTATPPKK